VVAARALQQHRYQGTGIHANAGLTPALLARDCRLDRTGLRLLSAAVEKLALSARGYDRVRKVSRTIADLTGADRIEADHVAEALQFRG
jgi:magnesium chelatase family protein